MAPVIKLAVGVAGTSLLATAAYQLSRAPMLSDLGSRAAEVMVAHGITDGRANWVSPDGWTFRVARLSGTADVATRAHTRAAVAAIPGISEALWEDAAAGGDTAMPSSAPADDCQRQLHAIATGRPIGLGTSDATIALASHRQIDAIAQILQRCPAGQIAIIGHTALPGAAAVNLALSQARAEAVAAALAERGIPPGRMQAIGKGSTEPLDRGTGVLANQRNARIEFRLAGTAPGQEPAT